MKLAIEINLEWMNFVVVTKTSMADWSWLPKPAAAFTVVVNGQKGFE